MTGTHDRTDLRTVAAVTLAVLALTVWGGGGRAAGVTDLVALVAALTAVAGAIGAARRSEGRVRLVWGLLGVAAATWGLGQLVWVVDLHLIGEGPTARSLSQVGFLRSTPLVPVALSVLLVAGPSALRRSRLLIDGLIVAGSMLLLGWLLVMGPMLRASGATGLGAALALSYPALAIAVASLLACLVLASTHRPSPVPLRLLGAGVAAATVASTGFAYLASTHGYAAGHPIDAGWVLGYLLVAAAGFRFRGPAEVQAAAVPEKERAATLLPYFAVTGALIAGVAHLAGGGEIDLLTVASSFALIALLVLRQVLAVRQAEELARSLRARMEELRASEQRLHGLVQHSSDIVTVLGPDGVVRFQSESVQRVLGHRAGSLRGRSLDWLLDTASAERLRATLDELGGQPLACTVVDVSMTDAEGLGHPVEVTITNLLDQTGVEGFVLNMRDVSEQRALQEQLVHEASHDALTGLGNRALFTDRTAEALERSASSGRELAVLFLDLDGFKLINDTLGHAAGDALLTHAAHRLRRCVRPVDLIARLGGDEFAVLLEDADVESAIAVAERLRQALESPFSVAGQSVCVTASIGIATAEAGESTLEDLLRNADLAMYRVKGGTGGGWELYDDAMHTALIEQLQLETDLEEALLRHEFVLHYQPTFDVDTRAITGVEALVRWQHPTRGLLGPGEFIPDAERTGLIVPLGTWVLQQACRQAVSWQRQLGDRPLSMAVNVSGLQIDAGFPDTVAEVLRLTGMPAEHLVLEMTESMLIGATDTVDILRRLKALGVSLAIDDFGTGYSSLSYLHLYPVDVLKIDRSFVGRMRESNDARAMVKAIVQLAKSLSLSTVAEGIEQDEDVEVLRTMGCDRGQGFLLGRPSDPIEVSRLLGLTDGGALAGLLPASRSAVVPGPRQSASVA